VNDNPKQPVAACPVAVTPVPEEARQAFENLLGFCQDDDRTFGQFEQQLFVLMAVLGCLLTLRQAKLRKGGQDVASLKPFIATLWVANPTRQGLASHRKRVLRGGQQWPLRSVDSQHQGRVIEPREHYPRRAFGFVSPRATSARRHGKACPVPPGSKSRA